VFSWYFVCVLGFSWGFYPLFVCVKSSILNTKTGGRGKGGRGNEGNKPTTNHRTTGQPPPPTNNNHPNQPPTKKRQKNRTKKIKTTPPPQKKYDFSYGGYVCVTYNNPQPQYI